MLFLAIVLAILLALALGYTVGHHDGAHEARAVLRERFLRVTEDAYRSEPPRPRASL